MRRAISAPCGSPRIKERTHLTSLSRLHAAADGQPEVADHEVGEPLRVTRPQLQLRLAVVERKMAPLVFRQASHDLRQDGVLVRRASTP